MASASFTIEGLSTGQSIAVAAGATVDLALVSTTGVRTVSWTIEGGSDSTKVKPTITPAGSPLGATATFAMNTPVGAVGLSWIVQCVINGGTDDEGSEVAAHTATGIVGVNSANVYLPFAEGELFERHATHGITEDFNEQLVLAGTGGEPMPTGSINGAITTWATAGAEWVENTTVRVTGGVVDITTNNLLTTGFAALSGAGSYVAVGASPAATGTIRVGHNVNIVGTDSTGAAARSILNWGGVANELSIGSADNANVVFDTGGSFTFRTAAAVTQLVLNATTADFQNNNIVMTGTLSVGASPALFGGIRIPKSEANGIWSLNDAGADSVMLIALGAANVGIVGGGGAIAGQGALNQLRYNAVTDHHWQLSDVQRMLLTTTTLHFNNGTNANYAIVGNGEAMIGLNIAAAGVRNLELFGDGSGGMGSMDGGVRVNDAVVVPTTNPTNAFLMYSEGGAGKGRGSSGTITTFIPAEPHCPRCSRDFALAWENTRYGKLEVCMWCLTDALGRAGIGPDQYAITKEVA